MKEKAVVECSERRNTTIAEIINSSFCRRVKDRSRRWWLAASKSLVEFIFLCCMDWPQLKVGLLSCNKRVNQWDVMLMMETTMMCDGCVLCACGLVTACRQSGVRFWEILCWLTDSTHESDLLTIILGLLYRHVTCACDEEKTTPAVRTEAYDVKKRGVKAGCPLIHHRQSRMKQNNIVFTMVERWWPCHFKKKKTLATDSNNDIKQLLSLTASPLSDYEVCIDIGGDVLKKYYTRLWKRNWICLINKY